MIVADRYLELLDQDAVFASLAKSMLAPYKAFCQILHQYLMDDHSVAPKIINSVKHFASKLINRYLILPSFAYGRLDNLGPSQLQEYEAGCFLVTVSFTSVPDAFGSDARLFSRFSFILASGLADAKVDP